MSFFSSQVGLPYLKSKMEATYNAHRGGALRAAFWGNGDADMMEMESFNEDSEGIRRDHALSSGDSLVQRIKTRLGRLFLSTYPWLHATNEGMTPPIAIVSWHSCTTTPWASLL